MPNMSYCRHENTANDLEQVWSEWDNFDEDTASAYEREGRVRLIDLIAEMHAALVASGDIE